MRETSNLNRFKFSTPPFDDALSISWKRLQEDLSTLPRILSTPPIRTPFSSSSIVSFSPFPFPVLSYLLLRLVSRLSIKVFATSFPSARVFPWVSLDNRRRGGGGVARLFGIG